jgi:CRP-like cAMP-binding protein
MTSVLEGAVRRYLGCLEPGLATQADVVAVLAGGSQLMHVRRGETVCAAGKRRTGCYWLASGKVKLALLGGDGAERVMDVALPGASFGEVGLWADATDSLCAESLEDSDLLFIARSAIDDAFERSAAFARALMRRVCAQGVRLLHDVEACCLMSAGERVERYLVDKAQPSARFGNHAEVQLPASKSVVASSLNLSPETFSRELHRLASDQLVTIDRRTIHVHDIGALRHRRQGRSVARGAV